MLNTLNKIIEDARKEGNDAVVSHTSTNDHVKSKIIIDRPGQEPIILEDCEDIVIFVKQDSSLRGVMSAQPLFVIAVQDRLERQTSKAVKEGIERFLDTVCGAKP